MNRSGFPSRSGFWIAGLGILAGIVLVGFWRFQRPPLLPAETGARRWRFGAHDRILVLAPHPDDEVLGCAGVIQAARQQGRPVRIVYFTYGDNNEWAFLLYRRHPVLTPGAMRTMGEVRHQEALAAGRILGLSATDQIFLGYPDFGTQAIWYQHWGTEPPHRSMLTRTTQVPYADAYRPGAPYKGEEIVADLKRIILDFKPTQIFVSHPADHHPDHRALYLFMTVALWELFPEIQPEIHPYLVHFNGWPRPLAFQPEAELVPPACFGDQIAWQSQTLTPPEVDIKLQALRAHASEVKAAPDLLTFVRRNELFGEFPAIRLPPGAPEHPEEFVQPRQENQAYLTAEERKKFIGIEERMIGREGNDLIVQVRLSRPLAPAVELTIQAFGFRSDRPFAEMPKIRIELGELHTRVWDQRRRLTAGKISIQRTGRNVNVRIPLATLGSPDRVLTSVHAYLGDIPLDWVAWREVVVR